MRKLNVVIIVILSLMVFVACVIGGAGMTITTKQQLRDT